MAGNVPSDCSAQIAAASRIKIGQIFSQLAPKPTGLSTCGDWIKPGRFKRRHHHDEPRIGLEVYAVFGDIEGCALPLLRL